MAEKQRLNLYEAIFKNASQAKLLVDSELNIVTINSMAQEWFGIESGNFSEAFANSGKKNEFAGKFNQIIHSKKNF